MLQCPSRLDAKGNLSSSNSRPEETQGVSEPLRRARFPGAGPLPVRLLASRRWQAAREGWGGGRRIPGCREWRFGSSPVLYSVGGARRSVFLAFTRMRHKARAREAQEAAGRGTRLHRLVSAPEMSKVAEEGHRRSGRLRGSGPLPRDPQSPGTLAAVDLPGRRADPARVGPKEDRGG